MGNPLPAPAAADALPATAPRGPYPLGWPICRRRATAAVKSPPTPQRRGRPKAAPHIQCSGGGGVGTRSRHRGGLRAGPMYAVMVEARPCPSRSMFPPQRACPRPHARQRGAEALPADPPAAACASTTAMCRGRGATTCVVRRFALARVLPWPCRLHRTARPGRRVARATWRQVSGG